MGGCCAEGCITDRRRVENREELRQLLREAKAQKGL
jgi:hypothetical protein